MRAIAARRYLVSEGVREEKIKIAGNTNNFVASNATPEGRAANRQVELDFIRNKTA